jgi:hypothetical protein
MTDIVLSIREVDDYEEIYVIEEKEKEEEISEKKTLTEPKVQVISDLDSDVESLESGTCSDESDFEALLRESSMEQGYRTNEKPTGFPRKVAPQLSYPPEQCHKEYNSNYRVSGNAFTTPQTGYTSRSLIGNHTPYATVPVANEYNRHVSCCPYIRTCSYSNFQYATSIYNDRIVPYIRGIRDDIRNSI